MSSVENTKIKIEAPIKTANITRINNKKNYLHAFSSFRMQCYNLKSLIQIVQRCS